MDPLEATPTVDGVISLTTVAAKYGGQIASVLHKYSLAAETVHPGSEGSINIIDATVTILNQALSLLDQARKDGKQMILSDVGVKYVSLLVTEVAVAFSHIEPLLIWGCATGAKARELRREQHKKQMEEKASDKRQVNVSKLTMDEEAFLQLVETT